jgi:flagellar FliL protein
MAKPAKPAKPTLVASDVATAPKGKKKLLFIGIGVLLLAIVGGVSWYFGSLSSPNEATKAAAPLPPKFIALDPFTVNLQNEGNGDQFLQIGVTLKFLAPELEEKIKARLPEIRSRLLLLLSSKRASDLTPAEGKTKLASEIVAETEGILGLRTVASGSINSGSAEAAPAEGQGGEKKGDIEVLFTSFVIQ